MLHEVKICDKIFSYERIDKMYKNKMLHVIIICILVLLIGCSSDKNTLTSSNQNDNAIQPSTDIEVTGAEADIEETGADADKSMAPNEDDKEVVIDTILYPVMNSKDKWGYIDSEGKLIIDYIYDHAYFFSEGAASVQINGKEGLIGPDGKFVIEPVYDFCGDFSEGLAHVVKEDDDNFKHGFVNKSGDVFYKNYFNNNTGDFHDEFAVFEIDQKFGYVDKSGEIVIEPSYSSAYDFSEGLAMVANENNKCGFINTKGELVIPFNFDHDSLETYYFQGFVNGLGAVCENGKYGFINTNGKYVIAPEFEYIEKFSDGFALVFINGLWGYIDERGEYAIEPQFKHATSFSYGYALARLTDTSDPYDSDGYGLIDKTGEFITPTNLIYENGGGYTFIGEWSIGFHHELARVAREDGDKFAYIDKTGETVWKME